MINLKRLLVLLILSVYLTGCSSQQLQIKTTPESASTVPNSFELIYPHIEPGDSIANGIIKDSVFVFGNVSSTTGNIFVNGYQADMHPAGGWLAWLPLDSVFTTEGDSPFDLGKVAPVTISFVDPSNGTDTSRTFYFFEGASSWDGHIAQVEKVDTILTVISDNAKIRCGWPGTYDIFPINGTKVKCDGVINTGRKFYRLPLGNGETGWIEDEFVEIDTLSSSVPQSVVYAITSDVEARNTKINVPLRNKVVFKVVQETDDRIDLYLYNVMSWTDLIVQPFSSKAVNEVRWAQLDSLTYKLSAFVNPGWYWGWDIQFDEANDLIWNIHQAPEIKGNVLKNLVIALDPGHGGWNKSAIGPTGFTEKEANLELSLVLKDQFKKSGADVRMTRETDIFIPLFDRQQFVLDQDADISLSIHYNGLTQGKNPYNYHGSSIHYNHYHSYDLADRLYGSIKKNIDLSGNGLRYQDLAMARVKYCPAVLVETAFMLHPEEEQLARDPKFQKKMAKAIIEGVKDYLEDVRRMQREQR